MSPAASRDFTVADFDFALPNELIAQHPAAERSASRLLDGTGPAPADRIFRELPDLLRAGDLLVFNDTQVVKARLFGEKASGGKFEILIERVLLPHEASDGSANEVVVLEIEGWHTDGPPAAAVLPYLAAHGISARLHQVPRGRDEPGSRVLQEARAPFYAVALLLITQVAAQLHQFLE